MWLYIHSPKEHRTTNQQNNCEYDWLRQETSSTIQCWVSSHSGLRRSLKQDTFVVRNSSQCFVFCFLIRSRRFYFLCAFFDDSCVYSCAYVFTCSHANNERAGQLLAARTETQSQTDILENPELESFPLLPFQKSFFCNSQNVNR